MKSSITRLDGALVAGLLALGVGIPILVGLLGGSLGIPRNDDWVYRRVALELAQTGVLDLHNVTTMMIGQVVIAQPFLRMPGLESWAFPLAGITFGALAVISCYFLARQFLPSWRAAGATFVLLVVPGYLAYSTSFMTDVPTLAGEFACLGFGAIALRTRPISQPWLLAAAVMGCVAFTFREFAIAAPATLIVCAVCAEPRRLRHWLLGGAVLGFCAALYLVKASLAGKELGHIPGDGAISQSMYALSSVSLVLLPAALIAAFRTRHRWKGLHVAIGAELGLMVVAVRVYQAATSGSMPAVILGDLASQWGVPAPGIAMGARPRLFTPEIWGLVGIVALVATVIVPAVAAGTAGGFIRRNRSIRSITANIGSPVGLLIVFTVAVECGLTIYGLNYPLFDRYYWPIIPVAAILFMRNPEAGRPDTTEPARPLPRRLPIPAAASLLLLLAVSSVFMLNSAAFDGARWRAGEQLAQLGIRPDLIDAGYEWVGYFQPELPVATDVPSKRTLYDKYWPGRRQCGIVSSSNDRPSGAIDVGTVEYSLLLVGGPMKELYLFSLKEPDCVAT